MIPDQLSQGPPPAHPKSTQEIATHQARLLLYLEQLTGALRLFSVNLFAVQELQDARFLIRQVEAEINLLGWVLGQQPGTWLDDQ